MNAFKSMFKSGSNTGGKGNDDKKNGDAPEDDDNQKREVNDEEPVEVDKDSHDVEVLEDQNKSILWAILKQIKVGSEVKHLQLPIFVLQPRSLLEKMTDSFVHPELLLNINTIEDPEQRFLAVIKFFISGWHVRPKGVKNPLNPVIGEVFKCAWKTAPEDPANLSTVPPTEVVETSLTGYPQPPLPPISAEDANSYYVAEQLSHHPPQTAFCYYNIAKGIAINSNINPSYVKFHGNSAETKFNGLFVLVVAGSKFGIEEYEITLPGALVRGILFGTLLLEIVGKATVHCKKTGYKAEIEFKSKGMFRGKYNAISGKVTHDKHKDALYTIGGFWDSVSTFTNTQTKETFELFDATKHQVNEKIVPPLEEQLPNESRKYWDKVVQGMLRDDEEEALGEKRRLEEIQRNSEKQRKDTSTAWIPALFKPTKEKYYWFSKWDEIQQKLKEAHHL